MCFVLDLYFWPVGRNDGNLAAENRGSRERVVGQSHFVRCPTDLDEKKKKFRTPLNNLAVPRLLPRHTATCPNQPTCLCLHIACVLAAKTHSRTQLRPTRTLAEPRGAPQTATIMRTSLICLSEWGAFSTGE